MSVPVFRRILEIPVARKDGEEQNARYSPNLLLEYLSNLFLNIFVLLALITSSGKLFYWSITLFPKLHFKTSLFTLSLYNFIECPLVIVHCTPKKQAPFIPLVIHPSISTQKDVILSTQKTSCAWKVVLYMICI